MFLVSTKYLSEVIRKLKKKKSMGCDGICALHFQNASDKLICHLSLLYQMVFCSGVVPDSFCLGLISPILKKGKDPYVCSSYRPITVSSVFAKIFELLIINSLRSTCYTPPYQFGFQPKLGCFHALKCLCNLLIDADESDGTSALGTYYGCKAFDSLLHPQAMNELLNRGVLPDLVRPIFCMYYHIKAKICILGNDLLT